MIRQSLKSGGDAGEPPLAVEGQGDEGSSRAIQRLDAREAVKTLAADGLSNARIKAKLKKQGLGGVLDPIEIEAIAGQARTALEVLPRPSFGGIRIVGVVAILLGAGAIFIGTGRGLWAIVLGIVLVLRPAWGREEV